MNLECPGCRSRLKLDPAKLPAGAATAICPKCRTRVPIPGAPPAADDVTVQCRQCGARLKVNLSRLKPGVSRSKCPKCAGLVDLPPAPGRPPAAPGSLPPSAQTRRIDPREMGMILGGTTPLPGGGPAQGQTRRLDPAEVAVMLGGPGAAAPGAAPRSASAPLHVEEPLEHSDNDLGRLIEEKVGGLGEDSGRRTAVAPQAPAVAAPAVEPPPVPAAVAPPAPAARVSGVSERASSPPIGATREAIEQTVRRPRIESGARSAPKFAEAIGVTPPSGPRPATGSFALAGVAGGALVGGLVTLAGTLVPANWMAPSPEALASLMGGSLGRVVLTVALSGLAGWIGGSSRSGGGAPGVALRTGSAGAVLGALAGAGTGLASGGFDAMGALAWTRDVALGGLLAAPIGLLLARRS